MVNSSIILQTVDDILRQLEIKRENLLLFLTDTAWYMSLAGKTLKELYPSLIHVTCVAHLLHNCVMGVRAHFKNIDEVIATIKKALHQSTAASTWWCGPRPRLGWVEMAVGLPEGPSYPGHLPFIFSLCYPLNDRRRAPHSFFKIGRLFSLFLLSCLTLALLRLLILLLLLMSGNVHPNPGPIFPCSVCTGNVTWRGKSVQCCTAPNGSI